MSGGHVTWLQRKLRVGASGSFDAATRDAVVAFQTGNHLVADGVVGPRTFSSLCWS